MDASCVLYKGQMTIMQSFPKGTLHKEYAIQNGSTMSTNGNTSAEKNGNVKHVIKCNIFRKLFENLNTQGPLY